MLNKSQPTTVPELQGLRAMSDTETRNRVRALLAAKHGPELIDAISDEIGDLYAQTQHVAEQLRILPLFQSFSERISFLEESGVGQGRLPDRVRVDAAQLFAPENGFHSLEYEPGGKPYRWTGPRRDFSFSLYVNRARPLRLQLEVSRMIDARVQKDVVLLLDGAPIPLQLTRLGSGFIGETILPPETRMRATSLIFVVPCVLPEPMGKDARYVGVAFCELRLAVMDDEKAARSDQQLPRDQMASSEWLAGLSDKTSIDERKTTALDNSGEKHVATASLSQQIALAQGGGDPFAGPGNGGILPRVARIEAREVEDGSEGFYPAEKDFENRVYRWTGPGKGFSLTASVDRSVKLDMTLCLVSFADRATQTPLTVTVDGTPHELKLSNGPDGLIASALIPTRTVAGPTTFAFHVPSIVKPSSADRRHLGVAFRYLMLEPASRTIVRRLIQRMRLQAIKRKISRIVSILRQRAKR